MLTTILRDLLKHTLPVDRLQAYLPLHTVIRHGNNFNHIVNASAYTVETQYHVIYEGQSLCARRRQTMRDAKGDATCPGCIAIAKGVIARSLGL